MPTKEELARQQSKSQKRDSKGHFISTKSELKISAPEFKPIPELEKPLVAVSINNQLKKIMYWLDQIRKHQTTTLAFKLSIPLVVVPVIIAGAFSVGRISGLGISFPEPVSHPPADFASPTPVALVNLSKAGVLKIAKSATATSYLLSLKNGEIVILEVPKTIDLAKYANKQILVTGLFNKATNVLKVADIAEVQIFNPTVIPVEATGSAK